MDCGTSPSTRRFVIVHQDKQEPNEAGTARVMNKAVRLPPSSKTTASGVDSFGGRDQCVLVVTILRLVTRDVPTRGRREPKK